MADAKGTTNGSFSTPQGIDAGAHRIVVKGLSPENNEVIIALGVEVTAIGNASLTSKLVLPITAAVVVLFIVALTIRLRRRARLAL
jgi:acetylglutamate kinase